MYYYGYSGGYSYNNNPCCNQGGYVYPVNQGYGYGNQGYGAAIILVLFILLVIVIGAGFFNRNN